MDNGETFHMTPEEDLRLRYHSRTPNSRWPRLSDRGTGATLPRRLIVLLALASSLLSDASTVRAETHGKCPVVADYEYPTGERAISPANDADLSSATKAGWFAEAAVLDFTPSGIAVVDSLTLGTPQGITVNKDRFPEFGRNVPFVFRRVCNDAAVYTRNGILRIPVFILGGSVLLDNGTDRWIINDGGPTFPSNGPVCLVGTISSVEGQFVELVRLVPAGKCEVRKSRPYLRVGKSTMVAVDTKSGRKLLAPIIPKAGLSPGSLDVAMLNQP